MRTLAFCWIALSAAVMPRVAQSPVPVAAAPHKVEIFFEQVPEGFDMGPTFTVTIDGDGNVTYDGKGDARVTGVQRTKIDPSRVADLVKEFQRDGFFEMRDVYTTPPGYGVSDVGTVYVRLTLDGRTRTVQGHIDAPEPLKFLEKLINEIANTRHWLFIDSAAVRELQASPTPLSKSQLNDYLSEATDADERDTVLALIEAGANPNANDRYSPPLFGVRSAEMVGVLVRAGADVNFLRSDGSTPVFVAAEQKDGAVVDALIKAGARVNLADAQGRTPLIIAAGQGRADSVGVLLTAGANARAADKSGKTALDQMEMCVLDARLGEDTPAWFKRNIWYPTREDCQKVAILLHAALAK